MMLRNKVAMLAMTVLMYGYPPIYADDQQGNFVVQFAGEREWSATCTVTKANGREQKIRRQGRGNSSIKSIGVRRVTGGSCVVSVPDESTVKVTFTSTGTLGCPLVEQTLCTQNFATAGEHMFSF